MSNAGHSIKDIEPQEEDIKEFFDKLDEFVDLAEDEISIFAEEEPEIETFSVMLMQVMIVKIIGDVTGKEYIFNGGGSIVEVDKRDIGIINKYNVAITSCCGTLSSPYFKFV
jgi:hypothetical protein